jgi:hypothetical protein
MLAVVQWLAWLLAGACFLWAMIGEDWLTRRRRERREREQRAWQRDVDLVIAHALGGEAALQQILLNDLRQVLLLRALREGHVDFYDALAMIQETHG